MLRASLRWREKFRPESITWEEVRVPRPSPLSCADTSVRTASPRSCQADSVDALQAYDELEGGGPGSREQRDLVVALRGAAAGHTPTHTHTHAHTHTTARWSDHLPSARMPMVA
jgi:hypothetical protein